MKKYLKKIIFDFFTRLIRHLNFSSISMFPKKLQKLTAKNNLDIFQFQLLSLFAFTGETFRDILFIKLRRIAYINI